MTSKEAFEKLRNIPIYHEEHSDDESLDGEFETSFWTEYEGTLDEIHTELCDVVKKDLEVLEILKKHSSRLDDEDWHGNIFNGIDYEELDEEEEKAIKEWLER